MVRLMLCFPGINNPFNSHPFQRNRNRERTLSTAEINRAKWKDFGYQTGTYVTYLYDRA